MKIPPKILKHSVKTSNEESPKEAPLFTDNASIDSSPETPEESPELEVSQDNDESVVTEFVTDEEQSEQVLKPQIIKDIPKPAPVEPKQTEAIPETEISEEISEETEDQLSEADEQEVQPANTEHEVINPIRRQKKAAPRIRKKAPEPKSPKTRMSAEGAALAKRIQNQTDLQRMPESLPVLEAFQDFLDSEQRKMRKRIMTLSIVFTIITISLIAGGIAAAWYIINPLKTEVDTFRSSISSLETVAKSNKQNNDAIVTKLNDMIEHEREVNRDAASEIATQVNTYGDNLLEIKDLISKLQAENAALKTQLGDINRDLPDVTYKVAAIMNEIDKIRTPSDISIRPAEPKISEPEDVQPPAKKDEPSVIADGASSKTFSAIITFVPRGTKTRVACQLPIPE